MSDQDKTPKDDRLVRAYERMLEDAHEAIEQAQNETAPRLREVLDKTRDNLVELGELSREEAQRVADYIRRDLEEAAGFVAETGQDIRDWWRFDLELMEQRLFEAFTQVADQTRLQLAQIAETARRMSLYQAGEITGPGTLVCDKCGAETHFVKAGRIPPCAECGATAFRRNPTGRDKQRA
ncbi:zinc ribbon-containing protein [Marichromatium bheemlicum]|uniref:Zinc ribbon-containing protein n=1 Tax=Marichromatium bheemlicum TaxID=365339 RepID=A0ABX1I6A8_9GAMM|nr:zinc ribbon-containing protein [Marichromatium bheemlicum]NKN32738.1 zinc ribbon-containing protein [Marichromatium bheemlicum]